MKQVLTFIGLLVISLTAIAAYTVGEHTVCSNSDAVLVCVVKK